MTIRHAAILALATAGLFACGSKATPDTVTTVNETGALATAGSSGSAANASEAMATLPDYIPVIPDGTVMMADERGGVLTAAIQAPGSVADAASFYENSLKNSGMNPAKQTGSNDAVMLYSKEKGRDLTISVGPGPAGDAMVGVTDKPAG